MHHNSQHFILVFLCSAALLAGGCTAFQRHNHFNETIYGIDGFVKWESHGELYPDAAARWSRLFRELQKDQYLSAEDRKKLFYYAENQRAKAGLRPWLKDMIDVPKEWIKR